jgi:hypothetical protein
MSNFAFGIGLLFVTGVAAATLATLFDAVIARLQQEEQW